LHWLRQVGFPHLRDHGKALIGDVGDLVFHGGTEKNRDGALEEPEVVIQPVVQLAGRVLQRAQEGGALPTAMT
jgi:hypothetical protein